MKIRVKICVCARGSNLYGFCSLGLPLSLCYLKWQRDSAGVIKVPNELFLK